MSVSKEVMVDLYRTMAKIRAFEDMLGTVYYRASCQLLISLPGLFQVKCI